MDNPYHYNPNDYSYYGGGARYNPIDYSYYGRPDIEFILEQLLNKNLEHLVKEDHDIKQETSKLLQQLMSEKDENKMLMLKNMIKESMKRDKSLQDQISDLVIIIASRRSR
jgi:hypothetical protein